MMVETTNASKAFANWNTIDWDIIKVKVQQLQTRIAKAMRENKYRKVQSLQWILTHSYYAKLLAIRRVTQNKGKNTAGVDKVIWRTPSQKLNAVNQLNRNQYKTLPLKRVYIPKSNGKLRPLSIPAMRCRAMQALHQLALEPVAETVADKNSYGFRPKRSCADAIEQCFIALSKRIAPQWVLEGDIKSCFDKINHEWLLKNIPMDKSMLSKWLNAGYVEQQQLHATIEGVPQGGIISPTLLTITLSGLEQRVKKAAGLHNKVNIVTYADDFIITGATREILEQKIKPVVISFLKERGLELSEEKTLITHINQGFDFLGHNVRKYKQKLLIKPASKSIKSFLKNIREIVRALRPAKTEQLIKALNVRIRGWTNYYRHVVSKVIFGKLDIEIFHLIWRWAKRRHPKKSIYWIRNKYFCTVQNRHWVFNAGMVKHYDRFQLLSLILAKSVPIVRHIKIRAEATPYDTKYDEYFEKRKAKKNLYDSINRV